MAVGVPEEDVFAAADAVLGRGERPTVERVRLELGRGSPARVGGLLDLWWSRLAARLKGETRLPTLPSDVSQAFITVWQQATYFAQEAAELSMTAQRQELSEERSRVANVEEQTRPELACLINRATDETKARQAVEARLADLELLLDQRQAQIDAVQSRCDDLMCERNLARQQAQNIQKQLEDLRSKAEQERIAQEGYVRGIEQRAHREVDTLRREIKASSSQLKTKNKECAQLQRKMEAAQAELSRALQTAAASQARSETLEQQLKRRRNSPPVKLKSKSQTAAKPKVDR
jgi:chromosome segregation ATPase